MPNYTEYSREDLVADESFTNYLLQKNAEDVNFWQHWINANPQCSHEVAKARQLFFMIRQAEALGTEETRQAEIDTQYAALQALLRGTAPEKTGKLFQMPIGKQSANLRSKNSAWKIAGVAAVFLIVASVWNYFGAASNNRFQNAFVSFATTGSIARTITLPDGSEVRLNVFSSIAIAKDFNAKKRNVLLTGSALFHVHKNHAKPFEVITGAVKTTALGTSFYISNQHPQTLSVSLLEGKVRVEGPQNFVELMPGEKAVANAGAPIVKNTFVKTGLAALSTGKITFDKANLEEIKTALEEVFNVAVLIKGVPPEIGFTGSFDTKNIEAILEALQFTYNLKYSVQAQKVIITFN